MTGRIDYKAIAAEAVDLLCSIGHSGLHPTRQRELWQRALDLDRKLRPYRERTIVWTEEEGDVNPPRKESGKPLPVVELADGVVHIGVHDDRRRAAGCSLPSSRPSQAGT